MLPSLRPTPNGTMEQTFFMPAFLEDNAIGVARDPEYENRLMKRDPTVAQALRYGDWSVFAGQVFREFNRSIHVVHDFEIPSNWMRWRGIDWGYAAPWCVHFFAKNPDTRRIYVYREIYKTGITDPQQARMINEASLPEEVFSFTFADPSMWKRDSSREQVTSTYDQYLANGVLLTKADNDHKNKMRKAHSSLKPMGDGLPGVQIFESCRNLIRTLPALMSDPNDPEDLMDGQEDHPFDAYTYGLTQWRDPEPDKKEQSKPKQKSKGIYGIKNL